jgi:hypothetical protein
MRSACFCIALLVFSGEQGVAQVSATAEHREPNRSEPSRANQQKNPAKSVSHGATNQSQQTAPKPQHSPASWSQRIWAWYCALQFGEQLGLWTLLVTAAFLLFTILTWHQMLVSNRLTTKEQKESARDTKKALKLTRESVDAMANQAASLEAVRNWFIEGQRARLTFQDSSGGQVERVSRIDIALVNSGNTPANNVSVCYAMQCISKSNLVEPRPIVFSQAYGFDDDYRRMFLAMGGMKQWLDGQPTTFLSSQDFWEAADASPVQRRFVGTINSGARRQLRVRWGGGRIDFYGQRPLEPGEWSPRDSFAMEFNDIRNLQRAAHEAMLKPRREGEPPPEPQPFPSFPVVFVVARVVYTDVFGQTHNTLYCARWIDPPSNEVAEWDSGNYAD